MTTYPLGRIPSIPDDRNYLLSKYIPFFMPAIKTAFPDQKRWGYPRTHSLDQKDTGHCTGFSIANFGITLPVFDHFNNTSGHSFYYKCKVEDGEPLQENGSSIHSVAKVMKKEGIIKTYAFAKSIKEIVYWVLTKGPVIVGIEWTEGMFEPDKKNIIRPTGQIVGGHALLIDEVKRPGLVGLHSSWGDEWGVNGRAYMTFADFQKIFARNGEAIAAVEI